MKVYNLCCENTHRFDGWFSSEEDFIAQSEQFLIECPVCASSDVRKLPSAPRLNLSHAQEPQPDAVAQFQAQWMAAAREVLANTEDVGEKFAEEARRMHYDEAPPRGIRGVATLDDRQALAEEGIDVIQFPMPVALKQPLQ